MTAVPAGSRRMPGPLALRLALLSSRPLWRVIVLIVAAAATVFWANVAMAAPTDYPNGSRNPDKWYYCYTSRGVDNSSYGGDWSPFVCDDLMWQESGGTPGVYESVQMLGMVEAGKPSPGFAGQLRGYVIPPRGIQQYTYSCLAYSQKTRSVMLYFVDANTRANGGVWTSFDGSGWTVDAESPTVPGNPETTAVLNVIGTVRSTVYDRFWTDDIVSTYNGGSSNPPALQFWFDARARNIHSDYVGETGYNCKIIGWSSWPQWLDENPEWVPPVDDVVSNPTPTPWPGFGTVTPLLPVSNTVELVLGEPGEPVCAVIVPGRVISETVFGVAIDTGWNNYEVCAQPTEYKVEFFGIDFMGYFILAIGVMSIGVVWRLFKGSG